MMRELDQISKSFKENDATLLRKDFSLFEANLSIDIAPFLREIAARAKREKKGDLAVVRVYKYRFNKEQMLLAYAGNRVEKVVILMGYGTHENFCRDLKY